MTTLATAELDEGSHRYFTLFSSGSNRIASCHALMDACIMSATGWLSP